MSHSLKLFLPLLIVPSGVLFSVWLNLQGKLDELQSDNKATCFLKQVRTPETSAEEGKIGLTTWFQGFL